MVCIAFFNSMSNIASASAPVDAFLEFLKPVLDTILFLSHWLLSHITIVETMDSSERKFESCRNDINPLKEYWTSQGSNQRHHVLQSELRGSARQMLGNVLWNFRPLVFFAARPSHISQARWCLLETMYETDILLLKEET